MSFSHLFRRRARAAAAGSAAVLLLGWGAAGRAQTAAPLTAADFTLTLARIDTSGNPIALDSNGLNSFFSAARCSCPGTVAVNLAINSDSVANLTSTDTLEATVMVGPNCGDTADATCPSLGSVLNLDASTTSVSQTLQTTALFAAGVPNTSCDALTLTPNRIWTIIRQDGVLLTSQPSLAIGFGGGPPPAPTAVQTVSADSGLVVSWTTTGDQSAIQGHQVLCSPAPAPLPAPAYDATCAAALPPSSATGAFTPLASFVCSDLISVGTTQARVHGLQNGTAYQVAVMAIGNDGSPSVPSAPATGTPAPTVGFDDLYKQAGGTAQGCSVGGPLKQHGVGSRLLAAALVIVLALRASRCRRARTGARGRRHGRGRTGAGAALLIALALPLAHAGAARADDDDDNPVQEERGFRPTLFPDETVRPPARSSPRNWYLELRFGPYHPDVDSEFEARGSTARPFDQIFSSSKRLMTQVELDRQIYHRGGTWALGVSAGLYRASAASLSADLTMRSGDETALRLVPLSAAVVYRADVWHERSRFPFIPYAKLGLDCTLWSISDTAKTSGAMSGSTFGWHAAAGISLDLSFLEPDAARTMDMESGVNQFALFFEGARYAVDGFGSGSVLRVGDTTWMAGLMLEL